MYVSMSFVQKGKKEKAKARKGKSKIASNQLLLQKLLHLALFLPRVGVSGRKQ